MTKTKIKKEEKNKYFVNVSRMINELDISCKTNGVYATPRTTYSYFSGILLGLKIGKKITEEEYEELFKTLDKKLSKKVVICFNWPWSKHKHNKSCYANFYKVWSEVAE